MARVSPDSVTGTTAEILAGLRPAFRADTWEQSYPPVSWKVTAGNSSPINDGAAAVLITSSETARRLGLRPRARLHSFAVAGDDPVYMLTGIIPATQKVLGRAGLSLADIGAFEVNEAFASVVLAWLAETGADPGPGQRQRRRDRPRPPARRQRRPPDGHSAVPRSELAENPSLGLSSAGLRSSSSVRRQAVAA